MMIPVAIASIQQETPTTKSFRLDLGGKKFTFKPGQWIDCYAQPDQDILVAGYSLTSSPLARGTIDIAVKLGGDNHVTRYLHTGVKIGDTLYVDGGQGNFHYERSAGDSIVLIGGGIGVTPLMSILRYVDGAAPYARLTLVHSAKTESELLFREQLLEIARRNRNIRYEATVTGASATSWDGHFGRIDADFLIKCDVDVDAAFFVCGPSTMILDMRSLLDGMGVPPERIKYEQWW